MYFDLKSITYLLLLEPNANAKPNSQYEIPPQHASITLVSIIFMVFFARTVPAQSIANPSWVKTISVNNVDLQVT